MKTKILVPITGAMIRAVRNLYDEQLGGWPLRMERDGQIAVYPYKNPHTGRHARRHAIGPYRVRL